jgi:hypothetical protein
MKRFLLFGAFAAALVAAPAKRTFTGTVTDTMCGADHGMMDAKRDSKCVRECVKMDPARWKYALLEGKNVWTLSDQKAGDKYAGQKVTVTGSLDEKTKTIQVESIAPSR